MSGRTLRIAAGTKDTYPPVLSLARFGQSMGRDVEVHPPQGREANRRQPKALSATTPAPAPAGRPVRDGALVRTDLPGPAVSETPEGVPRRLPHASRRGTGGAAESPAPPGRNGTSGGRFRRHHLRRHTPSHRPLDAFLTRRPPSLPRQKTGPPLFSNCATANQGADAGPSGRTWPQHPLPGEAGRGRATEQYTKHAPGGWHARYQVSRCVTRRHRLPEAVSGAWCRTPLPPRDLAAP